MIYEFMVISFKNFIETGKANFYIMGATECSGLY